MSARSGFLLLGGYLGDFSATQEEIAFPASDEAIRFTSSAISSVNVPSACPRVGACVLLVPLLAAGD